MKSFKDYLDESLLIEEGGGGSGLTAFDIDETLFHTFSLIYVMKDGKIVKKLNNQEFNTYKLHDGESFDFREFRDAKKFRDTSKPIERMFAKAQAILTNVKKTPGSRVILLTARADFDDKKVFLQTFRDHGLDIDSIYVERGGNLKGSPADNKVKILQQHIDTHKYKRVRLFDDAESNLKAFLAMKEKNKDVQFFAYLVDPKTGSVKTYK